MMLMGGQVVENEINAVSLRIALTTALPRLEDIRRCFPLVDHSFKNVGVDVIEGQELLHAGGSVVRCPEPLGMSSASPGVSVDWTQLHRAKLVETDNVSIRRLPVVEFQNAVFFTSKSGSGDSFQVFVR